jgi:prevent-host-death family protein
MNTIHPEILYQVDRRSVFGLYLVMIEKWRNPMKLSSQIKPIRYLKSHTAEIVRKLYEQREPLIITQNGEAKVGIQDIESYEQTQETMALLKIMALGARQIGEGKVLPAADVIKRLRQRDEVH